MNTAPFADVPMFADLRRHFNVARWANRGMYAFNFCIAATWATILRPHSTSGFWWVFVVLACVGMMVSAVALAEMETREAFYMVELQALWNKMSPTAKLIASHHQSYDHPEHEENHARKHRVR